MGWKHIVIEGHCLFDIGNIEDTIPKCCKIKPGNVGLHCLDDGEDDNKKCSFFAYGRARSTVVLTDELGEEVTYGIFWSDEDRANNEVWGKKEKDWIRNMKQKIDNDKG